MKTITNTEEGFTLTEVTTTYYYDAFGRRIAKASDTKVKTKFINGKHLKTVKYHVQKQRTKQQSTLMLWDGNRQAQEYTDTHVFTTVYEQNSFAPVARLVWLKDELLKAANDEIKNAERESWEDEPELIPSMQIYYYHNDHLGTPNELTNQQGEVIWLADYEAWGNTAKVVWREEKFEQLQVSADELQPIRFQGQSFDIETGLHYNRFRYFDPDLGMFTTRDPIGLMGGVNTFQYAPNPTGWVDPFGLSESVYRLVDDGGKTIYYGITGRDEYTRQLEHINNGKLFAKMEVIAKGLSHDEARSLEGALIRSRIPSNLQDLSVEKQLEGAGLINKNRGRVPSRWISKDPINDLEHKLLKEPEEVARPKCKC